MKPQGERAGVSCGLPRGCSCPAAAPGAPGGNGIPGGIGSASRSGGDPAPLPGPGEAYLECCAQVSAPRDQKDPELLEQADLGSGALPRLEGAGSGLSRQKIERGLHQSTQISQVSAQTPQMSTQISQIPTENISNIPTNLSSESVSHPSTQKPHPAPQISPQAVRMAPGAG